MWQYKWNLIEFFVSHLCNMNCHYCFADGGKFGAPHPVPSLMTTKVAFQALDTFLKNSQKHFHLRFFGGEPLTNFEVIREVMIYATQKAKMQAKIVDFSLVTNGTLLDDLVIDFFVTTYLVPKISLLRRHSEEQSDKESRYTPKRDSLLLTALRMAVGR